MSGESGYDGTTVDPPLIHLERFGKRYGRVNAVQDVTFDVGVGEFVAIEGPSGSGKTTLLGMLGLLEKASEGEYRFRGRPTTDLDDLEASRLRNRCFGFVFQQFYLLPHLTAWENVSRPLVYAGVDRRQRKERALALLEKLDLAHRADHHPSELSGGEQQRVAIARALVNDPDVILADEPTGNLPQAQWEPILGLLEELHREGKTILLVSHQSDVAERAARRIELCNGRVVRA